MLDRIQALLDTLPPAEQKVAALLLKDPRHFARSPVGELALAAGVSKPTVIRFCRSVGFDGLSDFKLRLAATISDGIPFIHRTVNPGDSVAEVLVKVVDNHAAALLRYRNDAQMGPISLAVDALEQAWLKQRRIEFYGVGNSGIVAEDAQHKFFRLGVHAVAHRDVHMQVMSAGLLTRGDVVVAVSNSGRTRELMDATEIARARGATVVVITGSGSPLAAQADIHLAADHPESYDRYSPMTSRLLHLNIIDVLATCLALRIGAERLQPMLREMKDNLQRKRYR